MIMWILMCWCIWFNIEANWRQVDRGNPNVITFETTDDDWCDQLDEALDRAERSASSGSDVIIEIHNDAHFTNNSITSISAESSSQQEEYLNDQKLESNGLFSILTYIKRRIVGICGMSVGCAVLFSYFKIKYTMYCLAQSCVQAEKWSKWKSLSTLKVLASSKKLEGLLVVELETRYNMHDDVLDAFFIDIEDETRALDSFIKECQDMKKSWTLQYFVPNNQRMHEIEQKKQILSYLKNTVQEILYGSDASDVEQEFMFDEA